MTTRRKSSKKTGQLNFADELAKAVAKPEGKASATERTPVVGERVTVGSSDTIWTILSVSHSGKEVNLHLSGTTLERFRVSIAELNYVDSPLPRKAKEPEKPKIDVEEVREHIAASRHSIIDHIRGEIAVLKKYPKSKGVSPSSASSLDQFCETTEAGWKDAVEAIDRTLEE